MRNRLTIAFSSIAHYIPDNVPIILEPLMDHGHSDIEPELKRARDVFAFVAA